MKYYIYKTTRDTSANYAEEITGYLYFTEKDTSNGVYKTKLDFFLFVDHKNDTFFSRNLDKNTTKDAYWEKSTRGEWYLRTTPNNTEKDNLLELPIWK